MPDFVQPKLSNSVTTLEVLQRARDILTDPAHWTTGALARTPTGGICPTTTPVAHCFCTAGAIDRAAYELGNIWVRKAATVAFKKANKIGYPLSQFNDSPKMTHASVLEAFDIALAAESK